MGSRSVRECSAIAAATQGCASCSNAARPAARNRADSRLIFQLIDFAPKSPSRPPAAWRFSSASKLSSSAAQTTWELPIAITFLWYLQPQCDAIHDHAIMQLKGRSKSSTADVGGSDDPDRARGSFRQRTCFSRFACSDYAGRNVVGVLTIRGK